MCSNIVDRRDGFRETPTTDTTYTLSIVEQGHQPLATPTGASPAQLRKCRHPCELHVAAGIGVREHSAVGLDAEQPLRRRLSTADEVLVDESVDVDRSETQLPGDAHAAQSAESDLVVDEVSRDS